SILAILKILIDERIAVNPIARQDSHHEKIRQHDAHVEGIGVVQAAKRGIPNAMPIGGKSAALDRDQGQIVWRGHSIHRSVSLSTKARSSQVARTRRPE